MLFRVLKSCYELSQNEWLQPTALQQLREQRLRAILKHAYETVPLYHKKFDAAGLRPEDVRTLDDLGKLPFTDKQEIRNGIPHQSTSQGYDLDDCVKRNTSGTTGGPMPVFLDKRFYDYNFSSHNYRAVRVFGCNPWDKKVAIQYNRPETTTSEQVQSNNARSRGRIAIGPLVPFFKRWQKRVQIAYSAEEIMPEILAYQPKILMGAPSYLQLVAEEIRDKEIKDLHLKAAHTTGEVLDAPKRRLLESAFGCNVFDRYGAFEFGIMAWECKKKGYHINADLVILEVVRDGRSVGPGELGEIVVTGLLNYAMPLIRYRIGDIGTLGSTPCSCGRSFPLLESLEGRAVDCLTLPDGRRVTPKTIMTTVQSIPGVSRYRIVQDNHTQVTVELMPRPNDPKVSIDRLTAQCRAVLGDDVAIRVIVTDRTNLKAKFRPVISKLTVARESRWTEPRAFIT